MSGGHRKGERWTDHAVALWLQTPSPQRNNERPSRATVEAYGHRVIHAEAIQRARQLREDFAAYDPDLLPGFDQAIRALGLTAAIPTEEP